MTLKMPWNVEFDVTALRNLGRVTGRTGTMYMMVRINHGGRLCALNKLDLLYSQDEYPKLQTGNVFNIGIGSRLSKVHSSICSFRQIGSGKLFSLDSYRNPLVLGSAYRRPF